MRIRKLLRRLRLESLESRSMLAASADSEWGDAAADRGAANADFAGADSHVSSGESAESETSPAVLANDKAALPIEGNSWQIEYFVFGGRKPPQTAEGELLPDLSQPERFLSPPIPANPSPSLPAPSISSPSTAINPRPDTAPVSLGDAAPAVNLPQTVPPSVYLPALPSVPLRPSIDESNSISNGPLESNTPPAFDSPTNSVGLPLSSAAEVSRSLEVETTEFSAPSRRSISPSTNGGSASGGLWSDLASLAESSVIRNTSHREAVIARGGELERSALRSAQRHPQPFESLDKDNYNDNEHNATLRTAATSSLKRFRTASRWMDSAELADWLIDMDSASLDRDWQRQDAEWLRSTTAKGEREFGDPRRKLFALAEWPSAAPSQFDPSAERSVVDQVWQGHAVDSGQFSADVAAETLGGEADHGEADHAETKVPSQIADRANEGGLIELPVADRITQWQPSANSPPPGYSPSRFAADELAEIAIDAGIGRYQAFEVAAEPPSSISRPIAAK